MNDGLCECGCGFPAPLATRTVKARGRIKGQPMRFIRGHNATFQTHRSRPLKAVRYIEEDRGYDTPCWIWQLKTSPKTGYGSVRVNKRDWLAHRWHYEQAHGPIPPGLQLDHLCQVRNCVNPAHLEPVTPRENVRRGRATKLTVEQARAIELLSAKGFSKRQVAIWFDISHETVRLISANGAENPRRNAEHSF